MRTFKIYYLSIHCGFEEIKPSSFQSRNGVTTKGGIMVEGSQNPSDEGKDSPLPAIVALGTVAAFWGLIFKEVFKGSYSDYRESSEGPTTVWRWLGESAKRRVDAIKNWDPD